MIIVAHTILQSWCGVILLYLALPFLIIRINNLMFYIHYSIQYNTQYELLNNQDIEMLNSM